VFRWWSRRATCRARRCPASRPGSDRRRHRPGARRVADLAAGAPARMPSPVRLGVRLTVDGGACPCQPPANWPRSTPAPMAAAGTWRCGRRAARSRSGAALAARRTTLCSSAVWAPDAVGGGATVAVTIVPPLGSAAGGRRATWRSCSIAGSMDGWKMVAARRAPPHHRQLTERDRFTVIAFDHQVETPHRGLVAASDRTVPGGRVPGPSRRPRQHELDEPCASRSPGCGRCRRVRWWCWSPTPGRNEDQILAARPRSGPGARFTLGIGPAVNGRVLRRCGLAAARASGRVGGQADEVMARSTAESQPILTT